MNLAQDLAQLYGLKSRDNNYDNKNDDDDDDDKDDRNTALIFLESFK